MKRITTTFLTGLLLLSLLIGCSKKSTLNPENPVTLTMWHVYGEQADSPMNRLVEEFNRTTGKEKGIIINASLMSSVREPSFAGYYNKIYSLYDSPREMQKTIPDRYKNGENVDILSNELWELFKSIE